MAVESAVGLVANGDGVSHSSDPAKFKAVDRTTEPPVVHLPEEIWLTVLESPCTFPPACFETVMLNLVKNPNITSSHLFRADILYDDKGDGKDFSMHLKTVYQPVHSQVTGFKRTRTIVRQLIPRNPQLDKSMVQTCDFFCDTNRDAERNLVLYVPHVASDEDVPFYHPAVAKLAFLHTWQAPRSDSEEAVGSISVSYALFPNTTMTPKLERTALKLLQTVHKHGQGQLAGYEKRVQLDQLIPQKRYQDTYTRLKTKYGRHLSENWVEVTDPGKHVFEDIAIAAFLVEMWRDMYALPAPDEGQPSPDCAPAVGSSKPEFPGFVDIGCGNGILTYILISEGYHGSGFDARERKTWSIFPDEVQAHLRQRLLVPSVLFGGPSTDGEVDQSETWHNGVFPEGTFIVSNHADELTAWTPLLAYLNNSSFIAIPCCSHDLAGARFRAPPSTKAAKQLVARLPQQEPDTTAGASDDSNSTMKQAAETGSLRRTMVQKKMASAYSTLCSYVGSLAEEVGFVAEKDTLRIPSTRNQCIIGRRRRTQSGVSDWSERAQKVMEVLEAELNKGVAAVGDEWIERAEKLAKKPGSGH